MKKILLASLTLFLVITLSACTGGQKQAVGIIGGGVAGGLLGSAITGQSTAGTIIGAVGGAAAGSYIAKKVK